MANSTFTAIKDGATTLQFGGDIDADFPFDAPGIDITKKAVLTYVVEPDPAGSNSDVVLRLDINGTSVTTNSFGSTQGRVLQEIVEANLLKETGNTLTATLTDTDKEGSCVLRDAVVYYKVA